MRRDTAKSEWDFEDSEAVSKVTKIERDSGETASVVVSFREKLAAAFKPDDLEQEANSPADSESKNLVFEEYRQIALRTVTMDGLFLDCYPMLWDDREVVMAAVRQNGEALAFASERLRDDEDVFLAATNSVSRAHFYGSVRLRRKYA